MKKLLIGLLALGSTVAFAKDCVIKTSAETLSIYPEVISELQDKGFTINTSIPLDQANYTLINSSYEDTHCEGCQFPKLIAKHVQVLRMISVKKSDDGMLFQNEIASGSGFGRYGGYGSPTSADVARAKRKAKNEFLRELRKIQCI